MSRTTYGYNIEAVPTTYNGVVFRSQLEARWAYILDRIGEPWEYEPCYYPLSAGDSYLPDFWLPNRDHFVEVKGELTEEGYDKLKRAALELPRPLGLLGRIPKLREGMWDEITPQDRARQWQPRRGTIIRIHAWPILTYQPAMSTPHSDYPEPKGTVYGHFSLWQGDLHTATFGWRNTPRWRNTRDLSTLLYAKSLHLTLDDDHYVSYENVLEAIKQAHRVKFDEGTATVRESLERCDYDYATADPDEFVWIT